MRTSGSAPSHTLPPGLALLVAVTGVLAMMAGGTALASWSGLGLRAQIAAGSALLALPAIAVLVLLRRRSWRDTLALGALSSRTLALSVLLGGALWLLSIGLMELQAVVWPPSPEYLEIFRAIHRALKPSGAYDALVSVAVIAVGPGVLEELVIRGLLLPSLKTPASRAATVAVSALVPAAILQDPLQSGLVVAAGLVLAIVVSQLGQAGAVAASALLFAAMHGDLYRFLFTFTIGLVFGALRLRTGSLWPPIVAHATLNLLTFLVAPLVDDPSQTTYEPQPLLGLAFLFAGAAAARPLLRAFRRSVDGSKGPA
jgi:membrane protease YdiL (CAAX protease family)